MNPDDNLPPEDDNQQPMDGNTASESNPDTNPSYNPEVMKLDQEPATNASAGETNVDDQSSTDASEPVTETNRPAVDSTVRPDGKPGLPAVDSNFSDESSLKPSAAPSTYQSNPVETTAPAGDAASSPRPAGGKKPKKGLLVGGIVAAGLALLLAGGAAAYTMWYQNPDRVVHEAMLNLISADNVRTETLITSDSELAAGFVNLKVKSIKMAGAASSENVTGEGELSVTIELNGRDYTVGAMGRFTDDKTIYFQLNDVKELVTKVAADFGGAEMITPEVERALEAVQNRWVKVTLQDMLSDSEVETAVCIIDTTKRLANDSEHADQIKQTYKDNQFLVVGESMGSQDGNLGYKVEIDQEIFKNYMKATAESSVYDEYKKCPGYEESELNNTDQTLDGLDDIQDSEDVKVDLVVWVSRFGHQLKQVDYTITGKGTADNEVVFKGETKLSYDAVNVETPEESVDLETWQNEIDELTQTATEAVTGPQVQTEPITYSQFET